MNPSSIRLGTRQLHTRPWGHGGSHWTSPACRPSLDNQLHPKGIPKLQDLTRALSSGVRSDPWPYKGEGAGHWPPLHGSSTQLLRPPSSPPTFTSDDNSTTNHHHHCPQHHPNHLLRPPYPSGAGCPVTTLGHLSVPEDTTPNHLDFARGSHWSPGHGKGQPRAALEGSLPDRALQHLP